MSENRAARNRTLTLSAAERTALRARLLVTPTLGQSRPTLDDVIDRTLMGDTMAWLPLLPDGFADLIIVDPPYNLNKDFGATRFKARGRAAYRAYLDTWLPAVAAKLKPDGTLYVCGDWHSTSAIQDALEATGLTLLNRISWQREKGRGATRNWKNVAEDIWMAVADGRRYHFDVGAVMHKRRVIAPYRDGDGTPRGWSEEQPPSADLAPAADEAASRPEQPADAQTKEKFRLTHPSNFWDDLTVPFWSMPENTEHPTQKPEKLIAKLVLASSREGDIVFDPFLGSGTSSVVARKLGRHFVGIECDEDFCLYAEKRLALALTDKAIQGYADGVFWERNTSAAQKTLTTTST